MLWCQVYTAVVEIGWTNGYDKLRQWKEQWCLLHGIYCGILEVNQLTPAKAFVFSAPYSWLDRTTTPDSSFHVPYNYNHISDSSER